MKPSTFAISWVLVLAAPVAYLLAKSQWFRRRFLAIGIFWTVCVLADISMTAGTLQWFYVHTFYELFDPDHKSEHLHYSAPSPFPHS